MSYLSCYVQFLFYFLHRNTRVAITSIATFRIRVHGKVDVRSYNDVISCCIEKLLYFLIHGVPLTRLPHADLRLNIILTYCCVWYLVYT